jgi:PTH1 family peptidyl-tRNA hydrolase
MGISDSGNTKDSPALVVGLGNPGKEYATHRHNVGFQVVDALAAKHNLRFHRVKKARARVAEGLVFDQPVVLVKPQTFMNLSGKAVARTMREYGTNPQKILVIYDDLDLPLGRLRMRPEGGSGGHKGMRSIMDLLQTRAFPRLRVGIDRPKNGMDPADFVLQPFDEDDAELYLLVLRRAVAAVECWLRDGIAAAMDQFNRSPADDQELGSPLDSPEQGEGL